MKIAVTYENGQIFQHFGHTEQFKIYTTENGKIINSEVIDTNGSGHGALAGLLLSLSVDALICGCHRLPDACADHTVLYSEYLYRKLLRRPAWYGRYGCADDDQHFWCMYFPNRLPEHFYAAASIFGCIVHYVSRFLGTDQFDVLDLL